MAFGGQERRRRFDIQEARTSRALSRRYGLKGTVGVQLVPEVVPVAIVDDLREEPDVQAATGWLSASPAAAGDHAAGLLGNPPLSNKIVRVHRIWVRTDGSTQISVQYPVGFTGLVLAATKQWKDAGTTGTPIAELEPDDSSLVVANEIQRLITSAGVSVTFPGWHDFRPGFVLRPTEALQVRCLNADVAITSLNFEWDESPFEPQTSPIPVAG